MSTLVLPSLLVPAVVGAGLAQPMGPWLDSALPVGAEDPVQEVGACPEGYLARGIQLKPAPELYTVWFPERAWGRPEALEVITRAAEEMAWLIPEADPIIVGDISTQFGGELHGHMTHRSGIDADISVYWLGATTFQGDYPEASPLNLDLEANWLLIKSMLDTGMVERILLDQRNIDRIKQYTIESGELTVKEANRVFPEPGSRDRYKTGVVHHAPHHQEHMHVRVLCWTGA
jgi:murein endopeptidase